MDTLSLLGPAGEEGQVHRKGAVLNAWRPIAILAFLSLFPVSSSAQDQESEKRFKVTGMPMIDYSRSQGIKVGGRFRRLWSLPMFHRRRLK